MSDTVLAQHKNKAFLPLSQIENALSQSSQIPYESVFSLQPYLDVLKSQMSRTACDHTKSALVPVMEMNQKYIEAHIDELDNILEKPEFQTVMSTMVPSMLFSDELSYVSPPFIKKFIVKSGAFQQFINEDKWETMLNTDEIELKHRKIVIQAGIHILNSLYGQNIPSISDELFTVRNKESKLVKYYRMDLKFDYIQVETKGKLPKLSQAQIEFLIRNPEDLDLWLKTLPPDKFMFKGFCVGKLFDVTDIQVLSDLKNWLSYSDDMAPAQFFEALTHYIRSYIGIENIQIGNMILDDNMSVVDANFSLTKMTDPAKFFAEEEEAKGIYDHLITAKRVLYIEDLAKLENPSKAERKLLKNKIRSFVLSPMYGERGEVLAFLELGSTEANAFNSWNVQKLQEIFNLLVLSFEKFKTDFDSRITSIIQKNFTSIHPSVSWKFQEVAKDYYNQQQEGGKELSIAPIIFNDVFPLYGQSDIVHSSSIRNELIKEDLVDNIEALVTLMSAWLKKKKLHLLESQLIKLIETLDHLEQDFVSSDETKIVGFITNEVHPVIENAVERYPELNDKSYKTYKNLLDEQVGIIYNKRKDFERSVNRLNAAISEYIEKEEQQMQDILPHFFERYKTDGVEYNIYLGESILKNGKFVNDDLKNFKLWQLVASCEITRLVRDISPKLPVPLTTAEMIFVYNHSLSIRFRMDEKKFDVDGAYNVRYEILKKRIDKATIKSTGERLTVSGKVAIVYLSESDKAEYLEFFEYLQAKGYIDDNIEDIELNDVQGAEGLHALRISVI